MESRGGGREMHSRTRPAIARRSCDQCRTRKIGCDRGSPCSNCVSARVECTHSAVTTSATPPKQRVLISAQYEQKIDGIARDIDDIKALLHGLNLPSDSLTNAAEPGSQPTPSDRTELLKGHQVTCAPESHPLWDHSAHIVDFIKAVVGNGSFSNVGAEANAVLSSLQNLVNNLEGFATGRNVSYPKLEVVRDTAASAKPPIEAVVAVIRWAKDNQDNNRIAWLSRILCLHKLTEVCKKVYFAVDEYNDIDFIIANGFLSYIFFEHVMVSGRKDYQDYCRLCRKNLDNALSRLPLLLPATAEVVAALALGTYNAIENSKAALAWTFISLAINHCQTLGYHRLYFPKESEKPLRAAQESLFWTVYRLEKGLSLRLGRSSNIRDSEITLMFDPDETTYMKAARLQGSVYEGLYSPTALTRPDEERRFIAETLAAEMRELIKATRAEILDVTSRPNDHPNDPMRIVYIQSELICQSSLLVLILRAIFFTSNSLSSESHECVAVARDTLSIHEQCMQTIRSCKTDPFMMTRYLNWAVLHCPFVPFSILYTRAVQVLDTAELDRLDRFAASLQPENNAGQASSEASTHPFRLYKLLCQAARLYLNSQASSMSASTSESVVDPNIFGSLPDGLGDDLDLSQYVLDAAGANGMMGAEGFQGGVGLSDWFYGNQQMMSLLDENMMY